MSRTGEIKGILLEGITSIVDNITKDDFSEREDLEIMGLWQILNAYGDELLKVVGYEDCKRWYGPIFVQWYNQKER